MKLEFPKNFYWGAATSSHQVEGGNHNDWAGWEKSELRIRGLRAKGLLKKHGRENYISGRACDHYHRFKEDFDIAKSLGHNAYRFSIEWSRIEPEEGKFDEKEIRHYKKMVSALRERGIEPFVTLWHFTNPVWFMAKGGWLNEEAPEYFERYVYKVSRSLQNVRFWVTLNEPIVYTSHAYLRGLWPPQEKSFSQTLKVANNMAKAHNLTFACLHSVNPDYQAGLAKNNIYFKNNSFFDYLWDRYFLAKIRGKQDFIGLNYYFHHAFWRKKKLLVTDMGWRIYPDGLYYILKGLKKYKTPVYILENGLADAKDKKRVVFIKDHLRYVHKAIQEGIDVRGYFYWSLLDNFEWDKGFWPRFGLVDMDYTTMERKIRKSAYEYAKICKSNSLDIDV